MHIHVSGAHGEAKFWLEPEVALARNHGFTKRQLRDIQQVVRNREDEFRSAWLDHFGR